MAKEKVKLEYLVTPVLDQRATTNVVREIEKIAKRGTQLNFTKVVKEANNNVKAINEISKAAEAFSKKLSAATQSSIQKLKSLGKELADAQQEAKALSEAYAAETDDAKKDEIKKKIEDLSSHIGELNKEITSQKTTLKTYSAEIKRASAAQKKNIESLNKISSFKPTDMFKGVGAGLTKALSGDLKGGLSTILSTAGKAGGAAAGRGAQLYAGVRYKDDDAKKGAAMGAAGEQLAGAATALSGAVAAIAALVKFINKASGAMADLNKQMLAGTGFARDIGVSGAEYARSLKAMREAAIDSHGALIKFGASSETAMQAAGAFAKEASGSIVQTEAMLRGMGGGDLQQGMFELAKNAQVYGKALGMEAKDVAGFMGQLVNEVGVSHENVTKVMGDVVKQASQAGIPVNKFMAIFKDAIPELDMFTNRIEEVTGVVKLMSKTMDPRQLKDFMKAFGKGFDQMDFKQRLKMMLVTGPGKMSKIMEKDFKRSTESMASQLGGLGDEFKKAMAGSGATKDITKDVAAVAAKAMAMGVDPSKISAMQDMARNEKLRKSGDVLKGATAMRGMGLLGRMESLEAYAGRFTGGDITGLGEHVAKQLGVSEQEYKAILKLKDNMAANTASVKKTGRTSSVSINNNLKKILKQEGKLSDDSDESFEKAMQGLGTAELEDKIKLASTMQIEEDKENAQSMEQIAQEQVIATTSLGDKVENVLAYLLEKIYYAMDSVLTELNGIFSWMSGGEAEKKTVAAINTMREDAKKSFGDNQTAYAKFSSDMDAVQRAVASGKDAKALANQFGDKLMGLGFGGFGKGEKDQSDPEGEKKTRDLLSKYMDKSDVDKFVKAYKEGNIQETDKLLKGMDTDKMAGLLGELSKQQAMSTKKESLRDDTRSKEADLLKAKTKTGGGDLDARTQKLMGVTGVAAPPAPEQKVQSKDDAKKIADAVQDAKPAAAVGAPGAPGAPTPAGPKPADNKAANTAIKDTAKIQEGQAKTAEAQLDQGDDIYHGINDQLALLKRGVKFEQSWMNSKFQNVLKDATLESFRTALFEFAMLTEWDKVKQWGKDLGDKNMKPTSAADFMKKTGDWAQNVAAPTYGFATGGSIDYDQMARVHKGEYVVPKGGMLVKEGNTSNNKNVTVNATINVHTDADPKQIAAEVHNLYRAH
jgi:hypothetical protein